MPENSSLKQSVITNAEMLKFAGMSVFLGSVLLGTARRAYAATLTVTNTNDPIPAVAGDGSLRGEILAANSGDTIAFATGVTGTITLNGKYGALSIRNKDVTITGPGAANLTISGNNSVGIFYTSSPPSPAPANNVSISGLTLTKGKAKYGGAIHSVRDNLTVSNCVITNNVTTSANYAAGGGIDQYNGSLTIQSCTISKNGSYGRYSGGGGIYQLKGSLSIQNNTTISGNYSKYSSGGGVGFKNTTAVTIQNSTISNSYARNRGGGIYGKGGSLTLDGTTVTKNSSNSAGAGAYLYNVSTTMQNKSYILYNSTYGNSGGGIAHNYGTLSILNSKISGNYGRSGGGGADVKNTASVTITGSTVSGNKAPSGRGGGLFLTNTASTIVSSTITGNTAKFGGGIDQYNGTISIQKSNVYTNTASGAGSHGGAIYLYGTTLTVTGSTISKNTSGSGGGAAFVKNTTATIQDSSISTNGGSYGGGLYLHNSTLTAQRCTFTGNTATGSGGVVEMYPAGGNLTLENCTLTGNSAKGNALYGRGGGALNLFSPGISTIRNCTIAGNSIQSGTGGGINLYGKSVSGTLTISSTIIAKNLNGAAADDVNGPVAAASDHNLVGVGTLTGPIGISNGDSNGNQVGTAASPIDPLLGTLANNGGPTQTMALLAGSPAIDKGNANGLTTDQRGAGFPRVIGPSADVGAFERDTVPPTASLTSAPNVTTSVTTYTFTVTFADNIAVNVATLGNSNILVTGPGGFSQLATFVSAAPNSNAASLVATYQLTTATALANGTYTIAIQANQVADTTGNPVAAGTLGTFTVNVPVAPPPTNPAPVFASAPSATPNPVLPGQVVQFGVAASGAQPISFAWNFGDGATGTGSSVGHAFAAPGTYVATVTATDANGLAATATVTVSVLDPNADSDGDGFTNDVEIALGSNPLSATSSPFNLPKPTATAALSAKHLKIQLRFEVSNSDSLIMTGKLPVPSGFKPSGQYVIFNIGHVIKAFQLNAHSFASNSTGKTGLLNDSFKLGRGNFTLKLAGGAFQAALNSETDPARDLNSTQGNSPTRTVKVTIYFNNTVYSGDVIGKFSAAKGLFKK
jgi:hypothetical protein